MLITIFMLALSFFAGLVCYTNPTWVILFFARWINLVLGKLAVITIADNKLKEFLELLANDQIKFVAKYQNEVLRIKQTGLLVLLISSIAICGRIASI